MASVNRREIAKAAKRRRISEAARSIFKHVGFNRATTQEIARQAGVAAGTLFLYARDKRELLLMAFNDQLENITETSIGAINSEGPLVEQLTEFYRRRFEFWGSDVPLARLATADVYASRAPGEAGAELARVQQRQERLVAILTTTISAYARRCGISLRQPPETIANAIHFLYIGELRMWLSLTEPQVEDALSDLRRLYGILIFGIDEPAI